MGARAVDWARLESVCTERYRGFESRPIRQFLRINDLRESNTFSDPRSHNQSHETVFKTTADQLWKPIRKVLATPPARTERKGFRSRETGSAIEPPNALSRLGPER
jgi:hypothetical protein